MSDSDDLPPDPKQTKAYKTFEAAVEAMLEKFPERSVIDFGENPSDARQVYDGKARDDYTGEKSGSGSPTAPIDGASDLRLRQVTKLQKAEETRERIIRDLHPQLAELARKVRGLIPEDRLSAARELTDKLIFDTVVRQETDFPTDKQLVEIYAAAIYESHGKASQNSLCRAFNISRPTLSKWADYLDEYWCKLHGYI
jgi:hypothetical protein